jgi:fructokinase
MRKIYAIGETLLDIIFKDGQPLTAKSGGSMLNSVVSLGRISLPASFISEYGYDDAGNLIDKFLRDNKVDTSFVHRFKDGKTALALAFLDNKNDARYTFYKDYPSKRLNTDFPVLNSEDIVLCGSYYSLSQEIREKFKSFLKSAGEKGAITIYDPNFRKSHLKELEALKPLIIDNIKMSDIIRGSHEDFRNIFGSENPDEVWGIVKNYCMCLIYTANTDGVYVRTSSFSGKFPVKKITPVSTIGAGDNFNAGIIAGFYSYKILRNNVGNLDEKDWGKIINMAVEFASDVCMSYDNYVSEDFAGKYSLNYNNSSEIA